MKTKTISVKEIDHKWWLLDADNQVLGRFASKIAQILRGKHRPNYAPNFYMGDAGVIIKSDKIILTGNKADSKKYFKHSGYPGGAKMVNYSDLIKENSDKVIINAVKGMLPKNKLGREIISHLRVYKGEAHNHQAQNPIKWSDA